MRSLRHLPLFVLFGAAIAVPAFAQSSTSLSMYPVCVGQPSRSDSEAAHGAYIAGKGSFDEGDYGKAIDYFKDAYRRDCLKHELLNIIARAYELKGDRAEAVNALETYLKRVPPTDPGNDQIQKRIANLKSQIAAQQSASSASSSPTTEPTTTATASAPRPPPTTSATTRPAPTTRPTPQGHSTAPWVVVGVGGAALATGVALFVVGQGKISHSSTTCNPAGGTVCTSPQAQASASDEQSSGNLFSAVGIVTGVVGAGMIAGGLIWHFKEPTGPAAPTKAAVTPQAGPGYAGMSVGWKF